jgi:argininosuccinate lyase
MKKIWEKNNTNSVNSLVDTYCFKEGVEYDNHLILHDVMGSIAHAHMLEKIHIITQEELQTLLVGLKEIIALSEKNAFTVTQEDEDIHTKVESYLTEKLGESAKKIHTGRSRNDQVAVDLRLYAKDKTIDLAKNTIKTIQSFMEFAKKYEFVPMPGYTHMQKAMSSSVGLWSMSFAESLLDDLHLLKSVYQMNDQSPLGSGAAFGVSLPIDREMTAQLLGFSSVLNNVLYCQASRPKIQLALMQTLVQIMITASKFASDLLLFTTSEFHFFSVGEQVNTGSSIMPQKKNLDVMEYVRAKTHTVISYQQMVAAISAGLPSGYNADFGQTKKPYMESIEIVDQTLQVIQIMISQLHPNIEALTNACTKEMFATHAAYQMVQQGTPFRTAYQSIGSHLDEIPTYDPTEVIMQTNHTGGPGNLGIDKQEHYLATIKKWWDTKGEDFQNVVTHLLQHI